MDFDFSTEQHALRDMARDLFEKESSPSRLREVWGAEGARDEAVWRTLGEVGLLGLTIPERYGGTGGDDVDLALVLEEAGRAALPEPYLETVAVAAPALAAGGTDALREEWLPRIASGDAVATVQLAGAPFVVDADVADLLLLERDGELYALRKGDVSTRRVVSEDGARRMFAVETDASAGVHLEGGPELAAAAYARGAVGTAAMLNGIARRLLETTLAYVAGRNQFGRPVGSFQAVKHKLADVYVQVESSRPAAWYAAYALATGAADRDVAVAVAKAAATDAEALANREALQLHAGIGFTWEHDLHLWLKRGKALEAAYGSVAEHRARLAEGLLEGDGASRFDDA